LAGDHVRVVVRRDQRQALFLCQSPADRFAVFLVAVIDDHVAAVAFGGGHLRGRSVVRHDDGGRDAEQVRRQGYRLCMIARGERHDPGLALTDVET